ncbi:hypothetical protein LNO89_19465 [Klebsiella pneumoniae subsp. pneumoniae]|nr:hypothetical protein [Klebsiella pneumoniae subsp. pneumoniae]
MRRLPGILLLTVSNIDCYRRAAGEWLASRVATARRLASAAAGEDLHPSPVRRWTPRRSPPAGRLLGPTLDARDIHVGLKDGGMAVKRVTLALDVWQSLLHMRAGSSA